MIVIKEQLFNFKWCFPVLLFIVHVQLCRLTKRCYSSKILEIWGLYSIKHTVYVRVLFETVLFVLTVLIMGQEITQIVIIKNDLQCISYLRRVILSIGY